MVTKTIAFWNVGGMSDSSGKLAVFTAWRNAHTPDILFLEEAGKNLTVGNLVGAGQNSMTAEMADKNGGASTKNLAVIFPNNLGLEATAKRMWSQRAVANNRLNSGISAGSPQRRDILYLVGKIQGQKHHIYGMHANASYSGGNTAFDCAEQELENNTREAAIVGGDFNSVKDSDSNRVRKILPLDYNGDELPFTQWAKTGKRAQFMGPGLTNATNLQDYNEYLESIRLPPNYVPHANWLYEVQPHGLIDFVLSNAVTDAADLIALPNCTDSDEWFNVLKEFDHCPVLYELTVD
ncbi:endonuclease/exonuclease/phosphatase family protein [Massilia sp. METH4]|uniref:endonuclease/exonuclease/phosphatase family protein n=1 Tax=Massilia sp. METH4 TaxID=3123041 RepID=UPI0030D5E455